MNRLTCVFDKREIKNFEPLIRANDWNFFKLTAIFMCLEEF
jgi:hypothetical protein